VYVRFAWPNRFPRVLALLLPLSFFWCALFTAAIPAAAWQQSADESSTGESTAPGAAPLILEDAAEPLVERRSRSESDQDRIEALALFAAGRAHQQREEYAQALKYYQRALRGDPQAVSIPRLIIPLAFALNQREVAVRYALKTAEMDKADPLLLRNLGVFLSKQGDWAAAATLYEKSLAAAGSDAAPRDAADVLLNMEMGRIYHLFGKFDKAAVCFDCVLLALNEPDKFGIDDEVRDVLLGEKETTYGLFAECFLLADRPDDAAAMFEKVQKVKPDKARGELNEARVLAAKKQYKKALEHLNSSLELNIKGAGSLPYRVLADVLKGLGKKEELIDRLVKLHESDADNHALGYYLAGCYLEAEQYAGAESLYSALLKKSATLTGYRSLARIYRETDRTEELLKTVGGLVEKTGILESLGEQLDAILEDDELLDDLLALAEKKQREDPKQLGGGESTAAALFALEHERFDTADKFFNLSMKRNPDQSAELLLSWGLGLLLGDRAAEAVEVFQRGIDEKALPSDNPAFWFYLAGALEMDGRTKEAIAAARKAASLKEELPRFCIREAWILDHADRDDEAIEAYERVIEKFDGDHKSSETRDVLRDTRFALSVLCVEADRNAEAEEWLEQILDEFPDDVGAMNDLGYLWADQGKRLSRAERMIRKAVEAEPENAAYRDSLGWVLFRLGRTDQAIVELEKAAADSGKNSQEPDAVILDHLGDAYSAAGQTDKAKETWQRAVNTLRKQESGEEADKIQKKMDNEK